MELADTEDALEFGGNEHVAAGQETHRAPLRFFPARPTRPTIRFGCGSPDADRLPDRFGRRTAHDLELRTATCRMR
jgi:hypothetical protein